MSTPPNRADGYAIEPDTRATTAFFQAVFSDVHDRLVFLELTEADYDAAIAAITTQALAIVSASITDEVDAQRLILAEIRAAADAIVEEYEAIQANGVPASSVSLAPIEGFAPTKVQAAIEAILAALAAQLSVVNAAIVQGQSDIASQVSSLTRRGYVLNRFFGN